MNTLILNRIAILLLVSLSLGQMTHRNGTFSSGAGVQGTVGQTIVGKSPVVNGLSLGSGLWHTASLTLGCTDPVAANYDPDTNFNDGSCEYYCDGEPSAFHYDETYCDTADIAVLQQFITNANPDSINMSMDINGDNEIQPLELGRLDGDRPQIWVSGRLTEISCWDGSISCNLAGTIPNNIGDLDSLESLDFTSNNLIGGIPAGIGGLTNLYRIYLHNNHHLLETNYHVLYY